MAPLDWNQETIKIKEAQKEMKVREISYSEFSKTLAIDTGLRSWYNARKRSLLTGYLCDEDVEFFRANNFTFGIKLLTWNDWCKLLQETIQITNNPKVGENAVTDSIYHIGKWVKKQEQNWGSLSIQQKASLIESGIHLRSLYEQNSRFCKKIKYGDKCFDNVLDFFIAVKAPMETVFESLQKWHYQNLDGLVKELGGSIYIPFKGYEQPDIMMTSEPARPVSVLPSFSELKETYVEPSDIRELAKKKLLRFAPRNEAEIFLHLISDNYARIIAFQNNYPILTSFEKGKLKKMFFEDCHVAWQSEAAPRMLNEYLHVAFSTFAICSFGFQARELKKIYLEIRYRDDSDAYGGFYCDGEEYLRLSSADIKKLLEYRIKSLRQPFEEYKRCMWYQKILKVLQEFDNPRKITNTWNLKTVMDELPSLGFQWAESKDHVLGGIVTPQTVYVKKIVTSLESNELPEVYMISNLVSQVFEPYIENHFCIVQGGYCHLISKKWEKYSYEGKMNL